MTIGTGEATISASDAVTFGTLDNEQLLIGAVSSSEAAVFSAVDANFGSGFVIDSINTGFAALEFGGSVTFAGSISADTPGGTVTIDIGPDSAGNDAWVLSGAVAVTDSADVMINGGTVINNGSISVVGASMTLGASTTLEGGGAITIGPGGTLLIDGPVASFVTISFAGSGGVLELGDPLDFQGSIVNFVKGDGIDLIDAPSYGWAYNPADFILGIYGTNQDSDQPLVAQFHLYGNVSLSTQQIFVGQDGNGGSLVQLADVRTWTGATGGEWYSSANWTTQGSLSPNSYPLFGDTAVIDAGTAVISAADFAQFGSLDNETVQLSGSGAELVLIDGVLGSDLNIVSGVSHTATSLVLEGTTVSEATIQATGDNATLQIRVENDGSIAGNLINDQAATISVSNESGLDIVSGRITNLGQIIVNGAATIEAGATIDGSGAIDLDSNGITLTVNGSVAASQHVVFYSYAGDLGYNDNLIIGSGAQFNGIIESFGHDDIIDLQGVVANYASFDGTTLTLRNGGAHGVVVGTLAIAGQYGASDFAATSDGAGGTFITDTIPATVSSSFATLPVPAAIDPGSAISLDQLLSDAFGPGFLASSTGVELWSPSQSDLGNFSYWDPSDPELPYWTLNGTILAANNLTFVSPDEYSSVKYVAGTLIWGSAYIQVPVRSIGGEVVVSQDYRIPTFAPQFIPPDVVSGAPTPQDVVNAASAFAAAYSGVPNTDDCWNIAHEVAAAAGATMASQTGSTSPATDNVAGGFWRIAYTAPQDGSAVVNWGSLVEAGDILRIGWKDGGGAHSFTVIDPLDQSGSITVFDNADWANGYEAIGIHSASYWTSTVPKDTTIFRLDANDLYLVDLMSSSGHLIQNLNDAIIQGTTFNDLILAAGTGDILSGGGGTDIFADTSDILNQATITDFGAGDAIDFTDLNSALVSTNYDPIDGWLTIMSAGSLVATLHLPEHLSGSFDISNIGGTAGLDGGTLGTLYTTLFPDMSVGGTEVSLVTCFAAGTRIATPTGAVGVEHLVVGDSVLCADGHAKPIAWIGYRKVDIARHPDPEKVLPIRVMPHAFDDATPERPLLLSPDHAVFVNGVLIPVRYLINGTTVARVPLSAMPQVTYYHIELTKHDVILAEGLPVETYLDTGNRDRFSNAHGPIAMFPDFSSRTWEAQGYAPLCIVGPQVEAARAHLATRATLDDVDGSFSETECGARHYLMELRN